MHLSHKIPWNHLVQCLRIDDTEISLPVGNCGKIHLIDKATQIKVSNRNFLTQICTSSNCETITDLKVFSKPNLKPPILNAYPCRRYGCWRKPKLKFINERILSTVLEFVSSEEEKFNVITNSAIFTPETELLDMRCINCYNYPCKNVCEDFIVFSLYSSNQIEKLLWLDRIGKINVRNSLLKTYGGQAIGNGYKYLVYGHLWPFYIRSNAIIACGYEYKEDKWGELAPTSYFRRNIESDNDFLTFIPTLRSYLHKDVYMKDMEKTYELLRIIFRHMYVYVYLMKRFNCHYDLASDLQIESIFGFRDS